MLWITGAFCTSSTLGIEAITGLIPIYLYFQKLSDKYQLQTSILSYNHAIKLFLKRRHALFSQLHYFLENMTYKQ